MKKQILCVVLFALFLKEAKAQFTLEQVYDTAFSTSFFYDHLQQNGGKYVKITYPERIQPGNPWQFPYEMRLYNLNHTLWKSINLTTLPRPVSSFNGMGDFGFLYVTDSLFDANNLVEFMYTTLYFDTLPGGQYHYFFHTYVYDENLTVLFSDTCGPFYSHVNIPQMQVPIVNTPAGTKMMLATTWGQMKVFGLAGSLPTQYEILNPFGEGSTSIYPNPSSNHVTIKYKLPIAVDKARLVIYSLNGQQLKTLLIDKTFDKITLSTQDLPSGTYYYLIQTDQQLLQGKKFITVNN